MNKNCVMLNIYLPDGNIPFFINVFCFINAYDLAIFITLLDINTVQFDCTVQFYS